MKLNIYTSEEEVLVSLATYFVGSVDEAVRQRNRCAVALSGGSSPKKLYELLSSGNLKNQVDWAKVDFFFGDERNVPQTDKDSNYLMAKKSLFDPLNIDGSQIFAINTSLGPQGAAADYTVQINNYFKATAATFDLILLGLGDNSHTASLFPYTDVLSNTTASVQAVYLKDQKVFRITFTAPLINNANRIAFLVYGAAKAEAVHHVLQDEKNIELYPAQLITPSHGETQWFLDIPAASKLL